MPPPPPCLAGATLPFGCLSLRLSRPGLPPAAAPPSPRSVSEAATLESGGSASSSAAVTAMLVVVTAAVEEAAAEAAAERYGVPSLCGFRLRFARALPVTGVSMLRQEPVSAAPERRLSSAEKSHRPILLGGAIVPVAVNFHSFFLVEFFRETPQRAAGEELFRF